MKNLYCRVLLIILATLVAGSCQAASSPTVKPLPPTEEVLAASPTMPSLPSATQPTSAAASLTPSPYFSGDHPGWSPYYEAPNVRAMAFDMEGYLWAVGPHGLLISPDWTYEDFTVPEGLLEHEITAIRVTPDNAVWVGTWGGGVWRFDGQNWQNFTTAEGLSDDYVHAIAFIPKEIYGDLTLFFGTREGLSIYSANGWSNYINAKYGLPGDEVLSVATGRSGEIWVGTPQGAIYLAFDNPTYTTANGLAGNRVNAIAWAPDCSLWFGTDGGVSHFDGEQWNSYTAADGLAADQVLAAASALDGSLWFGTAAGVSRFDGRNWTTYTAADGLANDQVNAILVDPDEALWFGTAGDLTRYSPIDEHTAGIPANTSAPQVAYVKDGHIWLWSGGAKVRLTQKSRVDSLKLSQDGTWIAFTRAIDGLVKELWAVRSDGSDAHLLVSADDLDALGEQTDTEWTREWDMELVIFHYNWIPGQHAIAYDTRRQIEGPGTLWSDDLHLANVETGEQVTVLANGEGGFSYFSPDGSKVAIVTPTELSIMSADGKYRLEKVLEYPSLVTYSEYQYYPQPVWAPDSQSLRVALPYEDPLEEPPRPAEVLHIPAPDFPIDDEESAASLPTLLASVPAARFINPPVAFSPDLARIVYIQSVGDPQQNQEELHLANADGTGDVVIQTGTHMEFLGWAPDGEHFAFSSGDPQLGFIAGTDGSLISLDFNPLDLSWVDGESFLHVVDLGCALELRMTYMNGESHAIDRMWEPPVSHDSVK